MSEKQALNCRQIYPPPQGSGCFGAITPCPRYVQVQANYLLDCTINSIEIGWYLMSEDHTQDFLHIYSILLIDVMYEAFTLQPPNKRCLHHNSIKSNFSAAAGAHHLKCHLQLYLPNLIWTFHFSSHLGSYCRRLSIIPRRNSSVWIPFYDVVRAQTWRKWEYLMSDAGFYWHQCYQVIWKRICIALNRVDFDSLHACV